MIICSGKALHKVRTFGRPWRKEASCEFNTSYTGLRGLSGRWPFADDPQARFKILHFFRNLRNQIWPMNITSTLIPLGLLGNVSNLPLDNPKAVTFLGARVCSARLSCGLVGTSLTLGSAVFSMLLLHAHEKRERIERTKRFPHPSASLCDATLGTWRLRFIHGVPACFGSD